MIKLLSLISATYLYEVCRRIVIIIIPSLLGKVKQLLQGSNQNSITLEITVGLEDLVILSLLLKLKFDEYYSEL